MKMLTARCAAILAGTLLATNLGASTGSHAADILIGAGKGAPTHFNAARALCRQIQTAGGGTCEAFAIEGRDAAEPIAVLSGVRTGAIEVGIVPADWQHHAFNGTGPMQFMDVKFDTIRALFSLHSETFTLVARRDSGIGTLGDLAGKRVNIGNPGSSRRAAMETVMAAKGWDRDSFQLTEELAEIEQSLALCHNRVQAMVLTVAHPNVALAKTLELCDATLVEVRDAQTGKLLMENGYLAETVIPAVDYAAIGETVRSFGVPVTAVVSEDMAEDDAYAIVKAVFGDLERFKRRHPAFGTLSPARMAVDGLSAPLHPGALRYFKEQGLL